METSCQRLAFLLPHLQLPGLLHIDVHILLVRRQRLAGLLATLERLLGCRLQTANEWSQQPVHSDAGCWPVPKRAVMQEKMSMQIAH